MKDTSPAHGHAISTKLFRVTKGTTRGPIGFVVIKTLFPESRSVLSCISSRITTYDYWQDQPDSYPTRRRSFLLSAHVARSALGWQFVFSFRPHSSLEYSLPGISLTPSVAALHGRTQNRIRCFKQPTHVRLTYSRLVTLPSACRSPLYESNSQPCRLNVVRLGWDVAHST